MLHAMKLPDEVRSPESLAPRGVEVDKDEIEGEVVDLMAALNASVKAAKESRGEHGEDATVHEMRPSKKTGRSSTASKKTTKQAAAKKRSAS